MDWFWYIIWALSALFGSAPFIASIVSISAIKIIFIVIIFYLIYIILYLILKLMGISFIIQSNSQRFSILVIRTKNGSVIGLADLTWTYGQSASLTIRGMTVLEFNRSRLVMVNSDVSKTRPCVWCSRVTYDLKVIGYTIFGIEYCRNYFKHGKNSFIIITIFNYKVLHKRW